jgi:hypothetical protein
MQRPHIQDALAALRRVRAECRGHAPPSAVASAASVSSGLDQKDLHRLAREHVAWPATVSRIVSSFIATKPEEKVAFADISAMEKCGCDGSHTHLVL